LFYALQDTRFNEDPMESTISAHGYAQTIFAMPVIPMTKDFKNGHIWGQNPRIFGSFDGLSWNIGLAWPHRLLLQPIGIGLAEAA
jgi:hypothetical protein